MFFYFMMFSIEKKIKWNQNIYGNPSFGAIMRGFKGFISYAIDWRHQEFFRGSGGQKIWLPYNF